MAAWVLETILKLLHPVMPFVTEELWQKTATRETALITTSWPQLSEQYLDTMADSEMNWLVSLITEVRQLRAEMSVPPSARPPLALIGADATTVERMQRHRDLILSLGRLASVGAEDTAPAGSAPFVIGEATGALVIAEFIDLAAERARLDKEIAGHVADIDRTAKKLANADFIARAPEDVVEESRERLADARDAKTRLEAAKLRLEALA